MKIDSKKFVNIILRYLFLVIIAIPSLDIFYFIFLPLTKFPVFYFLNIYNNPVLLDNIIFIGSKSIEIVGACVAGSAYYFFFILNLATPNIKFIKRIKMLIFASLIFLGVNILRILVLSIMYINESVLFDFTHKLFWYMGSTIFIVVIWFFQVRKNNIKGIPFYSDLKYIYGKSVYGKNNE